MHAFDWNLFRDLGVIVHDHRRGSSDFVKRGGKIDKLIERIVFAAQLNDVDAAFDHRFGNARAIDDVDVTEIEDAVEAAVT